MSSGSESAWRRRALALFHLAPGSTREFLSFTFLVVIKKSAQVWPFVPHRPAKFRKDVAS